jgi:hypothetical protein
MANGPTTPAKDVVGTKAALDEFTRRILAVPHSRIKAALDAEKAKKKTPKILAKPAKRFNRGNLW